MKQPRLTMQPKPNTLHRVVFGCVWVQWLAWCLFMFFLLHPVAPVFAAEETAEEAADSTETVIASLPAESEATEEPEEVEETISDEEIENDTTPVEEVLPEEEVSQPAEEVADPAETETEATDVDTDQSTSTSSGTPEIDADETASDETEDSADVESTATTTATTTVGVDEPDTATTTDEAGASDTDEVNTSEDTDSSSDTSTEESEEAEEIISDEETNLDTIDVAHEVATTSPSETATSSSQSTTSPQVVFVERQSENDYAFSKDDCRVVGDSFYCTDPSQKTAQLEDALFAAIDKEGDTEIYLRVDGVEMQLTDNKVDDAAPYYDSLSEKVVWHSLRNDRYQIVMYDFDTKTETLVTETTYNNMQPMAYGDMVFWQAWIDNNWEIVRLEGDKIIQMTDNEVHDIAPYAQDNHVMWQTQNGEDWKITLYDLKTNKQQYLSADGDGYAKNPRIMLMYESHDANGDVRLLGYDFKHKEHIALNSLPSPTPPALPEPDDGTEERALVQTKPTLREENTDDDSDGGVEPKDLTVTTTSSSTTATSSDDVVVTPFVAEETVVEEDLAEAEAALDALVRQAKERGTSTDINLRTDRDKVNDLVIPPRHASSTSE